MDAVHKTMFERGSSPVTAPDQSAALRELTQKGEVAFPAGFAADRADNVAGQVVVMNADGSKFGRAAIESLRLAVLAAIRFVDS
jgi:hypothetical protein